MFIHLKLRARLQREASQSLLAASISAPKQPQLMRLYSEPELLILPGSRADSGTQICQFHTTSVTTPWKGQNVEEPLLFSSLQAEPLFQLQGGGSTGWWKWAEDHVDAWILPIFILIVGVGCSVAGLYVGYMDIMAQWHD